MNSLWSHFAINKRTMPEGNENLPALDVKHVTETELVDAAPDIEEGSYYGIKQSKLSGTSPEQLKSIRVAMVSRKTENGVSIQFPCMHSLHSHFSGDKQRAPEGNENLPPLDVNHVMEPEFAREVLHRRIPHEIVVKSNSLRFWAIEPSNANDVSCESISGPTVNRILQCVVSEKGPCLSELRSAKMIKWGNRRRVQYLNQRAEEKETEKKEENHEVKDVEEENGEEEIDEEEDDLSETEGSKDGKKNVEGDNQSRRSTEKTNAHERKRCVTASHRPTRRAKRTRSEKRNQIVNYNTNTKKKEAKEFIDRWTAERYNLAEKNMLRVMKEKNAVFDRPILRAELRAEARKLICDTGLLDHLLKHMEGKVAPGSQDRFMRRHNADGAMEYWLESADLMNIREQAGVQDHFWTPPPGWKLGDNPTQDPVCAREIRELREEIAHLKREMKKLTSKRQEEDVALVTTPNTCVSSQNLDHDTLLIPLTQNMEKLNSRVEEPGPNMPDSTETPLLLMGSSSITQGDAEELNQKNKDTESSIMTQPDIAEYKSNPREDRAAKIERLKSGFRICKPEGSFLLPNMAATMPIPHHHHHRHHHEVVLTNLASVSSLSQQIVWYHHPPCPVKPLAEKRPVIVTSAAPVPTLLFHSPRAETAINLNEATRNIENDTIICRNQIQGNTSASTLTYQRKHFSHNHNQEAGGDMTGRK